MPVKHTVHYPQVQAQHVMVSTWGRFRVGKVEVCFVWEDGKTRTDKKSISDKCLKVLLDDKNDSDDENDNK